MAGHGRRRCRPSAFWPASDPGPPAAVPLRHSLRAGSSTLTRAPSACLHLPHCACCAQYEVCSLSPRVCASVIGSVWIVLTTCVVTCLMLQPQAVPAPASLPSPSPVAAAPSPSLIAQPVAPAAAPAVLRSLPSPSPPTAPPPQPPTPPPPPPAPPLLPPAVPQQVDFPEPICYHVSV